MADIPKTCASTAEALHVFDGLDEVDVAAMTGSWAGRSYPSGHRLDNVLEAYGWHGKRFDDSEAVHPLVFQTAVGGRPIRLHPAQLLPFLPLVMRFAPLRSAAAGRIARPGLPLFATTHSAARLRMVQFRGRLSAAIIYDRVPILDVLRRVDDHTVLGLMDLKGMEQPYFFLLARQAAPGAHAP